MFVSPTKVNGRRRPEAKQHPELFQHAKKYLREGNHDDGLKYLQTVLREDPHHIESQNLMVWTKKVMKGNNSQAINECISYLEYALNQDDKNYYTLFNLANCFLELGYFREALSYFQSIDPNNRKKNPRILFNIGKCYEYLGDLEVALITYEKAFKVTSTHKKIHYYTPALINYSNLAIRMKRPNEAILYIELYIKNTSNPDEKIINNLAILYHIAHNDQKSHENFEVILKEKLASVQSIYNYGIFLYHAKNTDESAMNASLERALEQFQLIIDTNIEDDPKIEELKVLSYVNVALIYEKLKVYNKAIEYYEKLFQKFPGKVSSKQFDMKLIDLKDKFKKRAPQTYTDGFDFSRGGPKLDPKINTQGNFGIHAYRDPNPNLQIGNLVKSNENDNSHSNYVNSRSNIGGGGGNNNNSGNHRGRPAYQSQNEIRPNGNSRSQSRGKRKGTHDEDSSQEMPGMSGNSMHIDGSFNGGDSPDVQHHPSNRGTNISQSRGIMTKSKVEVESMADLKKSARYQLGLYRGATQEEINKAENEVTQGEGEEEEEEQEEEEEEEEDLERGGGYITDPQIQKSKKGFKTDPDIPYSPNQNKSSHSQRGGGIEVSRVSNRSTSREKKQQQQQENLSITKSVNKQDNTKPQSHFIAKVGSANSLKDKHNNNIDDEPQVNSEEDNQHDSLGHLGRPHYHPNGLSSGEDKPTKPNLKKPTKVKGIQNTSVLDGQANSPEFFDPNASQIKYSDEVITKERLKEDSKKINEIMIQKKKKSLKGSEKYSSSEKKKSVTKLTPADMEEEEGNVINWRDIADPGYSDPTIKMKTRQDEERGNDRIRQRPDSRSGTPEKQVRSSESLDNDKRKSSTGRGGTTKDLMPIIKVSEDVPDDVHGSKTVLFNPTVEVHTYPQNGQGAPGSFRNPLDQTHSLSIHHSQREVEESFEREDISQGTRTITEEGTEVDPNERRNGNDRDPSFGILGRSGSRTISQTDGVSGPRTIIPSEVRPMSGTSGNRSPKTVHSEQDSANNDPSIRVEPQEQQNPENVFKWKDGIPHDFDEWYLEKCINMLQEDKNNLLAHLRLYFIYKKKGDYSNARVHLMKILAIDPDYKADSILFFLGDSFQKQDDFEQALTYYRKCYRLTQEKYIVLLYMGDCYIEIKQFENAQKAFEQAILPPNNKNYLPFFKLGQIQLQTNQNKRAVENLYKAHSLHSKNADILVKLGQGYFNLEETGRAIEYLKKVLNMDPNNIEALILIAKIYESKGKIEEAMTQLSEAIKLQNGENLESLFYMGTLQMKRKQINMAADQFKAILKINNQHVPALIEYATVLTIQGDIKKSEKYFKHCLKIDPNNVQANIRLGKVYQNKINDLEAAEQCYQNVIAIDPKNSKAYYQLGTIHVERKQYKLATDSFKETLKINPRYSEAWKGIGNIFFENNQVQNAIKYYQRALECNVEDMEAKLGLANSLYHIEQFDNAIKLYEEVTAAEPNDQVEYNLANCYYMKSDIDEAIYHYEQALDMHSENPDCYFNLGNAYCQKENYKEALKCFKKCIELDPTNSTAIYNLGSAYSATQQPDRATKYFEKAIELEPEKCDWRNILGGIYLEKQDYEKARIHLIESLRLDNQIFDTHYKLAQVCAQDDMEEEAYVHIKNALRLEPDNEDAKQLYKDLKKSKLKKVQKSTTKSPQRPRR